MIIDIKNFGPIKELSIDLDKDLHLLYGLNGIGKSYAAYLLYCLSKSAEVYGGDSLGAIFIDPRPISVLAGEELDVTDRFRERVEEEVRYRFLGKFKESMKNTFESLDTLDNRFSQSGFELVLRAKVLQGLMVVISSDNKGDLTLSVNIPSEERIFLEGVGENASQEILPERVEEEGSVYNPSQFPFLVNEPKMFHKVRLGNLVLSKGKDQLNMTLICARFFMELSNNHTSIHFLPSGRSGLYQGLQAFAPILAELSKKRFSLRNASIELPGLPEPLADYFLELSSLETEREANHLGEIAREIQENVIGGRISLDEKSNQIYFHPIGADIQLKLAQSSSMVAELAPLILFLKHALRRATLPWLIGLNNSILFIEEPETHLHPEAQITLMEILAQLPALGVKLFLTSHSETMFHQLNNLILEKKVEPDTVAIYHLVKTPEGTVRDMEMVVTKDGIIDNNFASVAEKQYLERMRILEEQGK